ncbi:BspA family leucine-rich repeat surface protein [Lacticaseibacillus absianus]|uniref:BspA family leucine-rich repeat surface protein n=1 Tax=Lacticaseibacillus absianus TaxID=2729623 RepID=UPI0015CEB59F|nr:BspA family leucine-rich repeat surface protein [Lacticaseibacillus absianus]
MTHNDEGLRKKLYKSGKRWVVGLAAAGLTLGGPVAAVSVVLPAQQVAAADTASGNDGTAQWRLENGTLTITGGTTGSRYAATTSGSSPWSAFASQITTLKITGALKLSEYSQYIFAGLPALTSIQGLTNVDFSAVKDISGLFADDAKLTTLTLTAKINNANAQRLFSGMTSLQTLDLSGFETGTAPASTQLANWVANDRALKKIIFGPKVYTASGATLDLPSTGIWFDSQDVKRTNYVNLVSSGATAVEPYEVSDRIVQYVDESTGAVLYTDAVPKDRSSYTVVDPWQVAALKQYVFAQDGADALTMFGPTAPLTVESGQTRQLKMHVVDGANKGINNPTGSAPVKYFVDTDGTLHLGSGTLASTTLGSTQSDWIGLGLTGVTTISIDGQVKLGANAAGLFAGMMSVQKYVHLDHLDTSATTDMSGMFYMNMALRSGLEGLANWDTSRVTNMADMFFYLNYLVDDPTQVTTVLDLSGWNTANVTNMTGMFFTAQARQINFGPGFSTAKVNGNAPSAQGAATGQNGAVVLPAQYKAPSTSTFPDWVRLPMAADSKNTKVYNSTTMKPGTYIHGTVASADLNYQTMTNGQPVTVATDSVWGALGTSATLTPKDPWAAANLDAFQYVYPANPFGTVGGQSILLTTDTTDNYTVTVQPVQAKGLVGSSSDAVKWYLDESGVLHLSGGTLDNPNQTSPWASLADKVTSIKVEGAVKVGPNASHLFAGLTQLTAIDGAAALDMSAVTDMSAMFQGDHALTVLDVGNWNIGQVQRMPSAFDGVSALSSLDVAQWDTHNVTDMTDLFRGMTALTALPVDRWHTNNVQRLNGAFAGLTRVTHLSLGDPTDATATAWHLPQLLDPALPDLFTGSGLQQITFGQHFGDTTGVSVQLPSARTEVWLNQASGEALRNDQYLTGTAQAGTYTLTEATYTLVLHASDTDKDLATFADRPVSSRVLGQPISLGDALANWPGYVTDEETLPFLMTHFSQVAGQWTQTIVVDVHEAVPPMHYPEAGSDARLALMAVGTVIGLAGLAGILIHQRKALKED